MSSMHLVTFPRRLADTRKNRDAFIAFDHRVNEFHHEHGLADSGATERRCLAALSERREQIDHLDAGPEDLSGRALRRERWRRAMNGPTWRIGSEGRTATARHAGDIDQTAEHRFADRRP